MSGKRGPSAPVKSAGSTTFTYIASEDVWVSHMARPHVTRTSFTRLASQVCLPCSPSGTCTGLARSDECRKAESPLAPDLLEDVSYTSKTSASKTRAGDIDP